MALRIVPFEPDLLPLVRRFAERTWSRPKTEAYYRWRYLECPSLVGYLALRQAECVATVWASLRPYRVGGRDVTCLETHDWYCLPELRGSGIGVRIMQAMMKRPEPIVTVGGSPDTLALLPRLRWQRVGDFRFFALPLEGRALASYISGRTGLPSAWWRSAFRFTLGPWLMPRRGRGWPGGQVEEPHEISSDMLALYRGPRTGGILPIPDPAQIRWLMHAVEEMGHYVLLQFRVDGRIRGWSLSRVYPSRHGCEANLIDVFAQDEDDALYRWMISETLARLIIHRPDTIRAGTCSPSVERALRRSRFLPYQTLPISVWPNGLEIPPPPHHLLNNTADQPLLPYP